MADKNTIQTQIQDTILEEVAVQTVRSPNYDIRTFTNQNLLRSAKFAVRFLALPSFVAETGVNARKLTYLCDSIEFPGQTLTAIDYRVPGKLKVKIPYLRELNEVNFSFYYSNDFPLYDMMSAWIEEISPTSVLNKYFDEIVGQISLFQYEDTSTSFNNTAPTEHMRVDLVDAYPLNFQSLPSNWSDDGFHKMNVSFYFRDIQIVVS